MVSIMKKIFSIGVLSICSVAMFCATSVADTVAPTAAGAAVTVPDTTGSGPALVYNPSPGVSMSVVTAQNAYAISASNISASVADRNEYGVWSGYGGYYQQPSIATATTAITVVAYVPTTATSPFTGTWVAMGGAGGS